MRTTDWNYDFSSLPGWDDRQKLWDAYDEFYELPDDRLCCVYSIAERRMLDYRGYLAILGNKKQPELGLNISEYTFLPCCFASEDKLIFLQTCVHIRKRNQTVCPVLILNMEKRCFSYALSKNTAGICQINQKRPGVVMVQISGRGSRKIRRRWRRWYPLEQLPAFPRLLGA